MRKVSLSGQTSRMGPADVSFPLTDELGAADAALNYYELEPGDSFAYGFHAHENQEEFFHVLEGAVTFETVEGDVEVEAGEVARFGPGEFQRGVNEGEERVRALAIGAPQDPGETEVLRECEDCGERATQEIELADDRSEIRTVCEACGTVTGRFE